ncbi:hypothetical protein PIB30_084972 [Stylosanthes scabra]|uniref:Uncharacterized protein n=1 Tax=Stylosanthes scabra TaxID=79078 RepID=A0ABU6RT04_9FABA|nr:hypothetical protein [Stylosanthes scabra]
MSGHMRTNSKPYLSFVIFASLLLSSHVLTNELPEENLTGSSSSDDYHSNGLRWTIPSPELPQAKTDQYTSKFLGYFPSGRPPRKRHSPPPPPRFRRRSPPPPLPFGPSPMPPLPTLPHDILS